MSEHLVQTALKQTGEHLKRLIPAGFFNDIAYFPTAPIDSPISLVHPDTNAERQFAHCQPVVCAFAGDVYEVDNYKRIETAPQLEITLLENEAARRGLVVCLRYKKLIVPTLPLRKGHIPNVDDLLQVSSFQLREGRPFGGVPWGGEAKPGGLRDKGPQAEIAAMAITELGLSLRSHTKRQLLDLATDQES